MREFWLDKRIQFISFACTVYLFVVALTPSQAGTWLAIATGVVFFLFVEYITHRFILHGFLAKFMPQAFQGHVDHHDDPDNLEFMLTPNAFNVPLHALFAVVFSVLTQSIHLGAAVMLGLGLYQLFYEWTHLISHRPVVPITGIGKKRKKMHLLHHYKSDQLWFGVTNATFDNLAGTNPPSADVPRSHGNGGSPSM